MLDEKESLLPDNQVQDFDALAERILFMGSEPSNKDKSQQLRDKIIERLEQNSMSRHAQWLTMAFLGEGSFMIVPKLFLLWTVGLPLLIARALVSLVIMYAMMGLPAMMVIGITTAGTVSFQATYRDVLHFVQTDEGIQDTWDVFADVLATVLRIFIFVIRLIVELHNGLCPLYALLADVLYELAKQLAVLWFAAPALQYMMTWLLRLVVLCLPAALDLVITVMECFMFLVIELSDLLPTDDLTEVGEGMASDALKQQRAAMMGLSLPEFDTYCSEHPEVEECHVGSGRRLLNSEEAIRPIGETLLDICSRIIISFLQVTQALLVGLAPIWFPLLTKVISLLLRVAPMVFDVLATLVNIFTSDAMMRILDYLLQAIPILVEGLGGIVCALVIYLGSALCYMIFAVSVTLSFVLRYLIRPMGCLFMFAYAGCLKPLIQSMFDGKSCIDCHGYNTACGCEYKVQPTSGCGGQCKSEVDQSISDLKPTNNQPRDTPRNEGRSTKYGEMDVDILNDQIQRPDLHDPIEVVRDNGGGSFFSDNLPSNDELEAKQLPTQSPTVDASTPVAAPTAGPTAAPTTPLPYSSDSYEAVGAPGAHISFSLSSYAAMRLQQSPDNKLYLTRGVLHYHNGVREVCQNGIEPPYCNAVDHWLFISSQVHQLRAPGSRAQVANYDMDWQISQSSWISAAAQDEPVWVRIEFEREVYVRRVEINWNAIDLIAAAPSSAEYQLLHGATPSTHSASYACFQDFSRQHVFSPQSPAPAYALRIEWSSFCATSTLALSQGQLSLNQLSVTVSDSVTPRESRLLVPGSVLLSTDPQLRVWDPCQQGTLYRLTARNTVPIVVSGINHTTSLEVAAAGTRHVLLRLQGPSVPQRVQLCPGNNGTCIDSTAPETYTDTDRLITGMLSYMTDTTDAWADWFAHEGFFTPAYYSKSSGPTYRDAQYAFDLPEECDAYVLRIQVPTVRRTTFDTCKLELGLEETITASAQWQSSSAMRQDKCGTSLPPTTQPEDGRFYSDFGDSKPHTWIAIRELLSFGPMAEPPASSRRLFSQKHADVLEAKQILASRRFSWDKTHQSTGVGDIIKELHDGPLDGRHNPFFGTLESMPNPGEEAQLRCKVSNQSMYCEAVTQPKLPGGQSHTRRDTHMSQKLKPHPPPGPVQSFAPPKPGLRSQRPVQSFAPPKPAPSSLSKQGVLTKQSSASRKLQGSGIVDALKDWTQDLIEKYVEWLKIWFRDILGQLILWILSVIDTIMYGIIKALDQEDSVPKVACVACTITHAVTGVLLDFVDGFSLSRCSDVVDVGSEQCGKLGLPGGAEIGDAVFGNLFPMIKIMFGMIQTLPAFAPVLGEVVSVLFSNVVQLFPELLGEFYFVIMWFQTSSELLSTVEIMFEAMEFGSDEDDVMIKEMKESTDQPNTEADSTATRATGASTLVCPSSFNSTSCRQRYGNISSEAHAVEGPLHHATVDESSNLQFELEACGCTITQPSCVDGPGVGACKYKQGRHTQRHHERQEKTQQMRQTQRTDSCEHWPICPGTSSRPLTTFTTDSASGEIIAKCVPSAQCKVLAAKTREDEQFPFECFSANEPITRSQCEAYKARRRQSDRRLQSSNLDPIEDIIFNSPNQTLQKFLSRRLMAVHDLFDDNSQSSISGIESMINAGNKSYAYYQMHGIRNEANHLQGLWHRAKNIVSQVLSSDNVTTRWNQTKQYTEDVFRHTRQLLFGFSDADHNKIGCGWLSVDEYLPNTYPCCKGLFCCIPPPFPLDFQPEKEWFVWRDEWAAALQCPYVNTYTGAWSFAVSAIFKVMRDNSFQGEIGVWPYTLLVDWMWAGVAFPNNEWPASKTDMLKCVSLNIGAYVVLLLILVSVAKLSSILVDFAQAHRVILTPLKLKIKHKLNENRNKKDV